MKNKKAISAIEAVRKQFNKVIDTMVKALKGEVELPDENFYPKYNRKKKKQRI